MQINNKDKVKDFFRKEGFYLILFLCLCVIATVAVITTKRNKALEEGNNNQSEFTLNVDKNESSEVKKQNAERVEGNSDDELAEGSSDSLDEGVNVSAGTNTEVLFSNPVEGLVSRGYTYPKPQAMSDGTSRNIRGVNIQAAIGTEVKAAAIGEVKEVSAKTEDGDYVIIAHANGLYTKYSNLSKDIKVNVGDKVTEETVIGTVGESSKIFTNEDFGEHLNLQVYDSDGKDLDPTAYFTFNEE
ncbi:MAG: M23 family metallopeptidase [Clostridium sp.]|uniref:M23 family metallopeptidase n=1 Tax=Clostridium sp. TaxID=1506 RepID=UPI002910D5A9|nr:M23 family metallopeptidase [Clostridium sp.]MDU5109712.1 M23 family metallopeptidase [Clostridium sp.]